MILMLSRFAFVAIGKFGAVYIHEPAKLTVETERALTVTNMTSGASGTSS